MTIPDSNGNSILAERIGHCINLSLKLKSEARARKVGTVDINTRVLHIKRKREKHLFRKFNAYGFCYKILSDAKKFDVIHLEDEIDEWVIPVKYVLDNGSFLHFLGEGFEKQIFLSLDKMEGFLKIGN